MGAACEKPAIVGGSGAATEAVEKGGGVPQGPAGHSLVRQELARGDGEAKELLEFAGAQALIMGAGGGGGCIAQGQFVFARLAKPSELAVLFVGEAFLKMSEGFYYPLLAETPVCLSGDRVITLDAGGGDIVAINLPKHIPEVDLKLLMELLGASCALQVQTPQKQDVVDQVAAGLLATGSALTTGIGRAAQGLSTGIKKGAGVAKTHVGEAKEVQVGVGTQMAVSGARAGTQAAVKVSGLVIDGLMSTAAELGKQVGQEAAKKSNATSAAGSEKPAGAKEHGAIRLGKATFLAGAQIFDALATAGDRLATDAADEAAGVVSAKYGKDAGKVARDGMGITGDVLELKDLVGKKAVGKLAAKAAMYTASG
eukprot:CAMPEP_0179084602 /NCGR_PEP_ID=MMETSP0796-20121207/38269_1 /TAXON_ID=73915 /ORGANISM="Pyrodinium bahamense, Strain pbaha01" /LENGTH=368 /DNA_ID=CAMNT_0020782027 /DNA_START=60 /DNA_END=1163 /DNA_ORIENTATION=-